MSLKGVGRKEGGKHGGGGRKVMKWNGLGSWHETGVGMMGNRECMVKSEQSRIALKTTQRIEGDINK